MTALTRRPAVTAVVVALLGLAAGAGVRYALVGLPGRPWAATVNASVVDLRLTPDGAQVIVDVTLLTSEPAASAPAGYGSGVGIATDDRRVPMTPTPAPTSSLLSPLTSPAATPSTTDGDVSGLLARHQWFTVPLSCAGGATTVTAPTRFTMAVTTRSGARHEVSGSPTLAWGNQEDLCSYAEHLLPVGWAHPLTAESFAPDAAHPTTARLTVSGLTPGDRVTETFTSAELTIDTSTAGTADDHGRIALAVRLTDDCQGNGWRIPVGVSVSGASPKVGSTVHYVAVGAPLARWIVDHLIEHCSSTSQP